ncbi:MAG: hypothetical protein Q7S96_03395 [bacterium]|nr:hypothetical protein [bacterium]
MNAPIQKLLQLQDGDRIRINDRVFVIERRSFHPAHPKDTYDPRAITRYELGDDYVLEFDGDRPSFFQIVTKRHLFGFTSARSNVEDIETITVL